MILSKILRGPKPPSDREDINKFSKTKLFTWKGLKQHPSNLVRAHVILFAKEVFYLKAILDIGISFCLLKGLFTRKA
jgi:hypothetical protein